MRPRLLLRWPVCFDYNKYIASVDLYTSPHSTSALKKARFRVMRAGKDTGVPIDLLMAEALINFNIRKSRSNAPYLV